MRNASNATMKMIFAAANAVPATMPNPSAPAISAMMRKVIAQPNMSPSWRFVLAKRGIARPVPDDMRGSVNSGAGRELAQHDVALCPVRGVGFAGQRDAAVRPDDACFAMARSPRENVHRALLAPGREFGALCRKVQLDSRAFCQR